MKNPDFCLLAESRNFLLGHEWEDVLLEDRATGRQRNIAHHYGDPHVGAISEDEQWFVTGGEGVVCCHVSGATMTFFRQGGQPFLSHEIPCLFVHDLRFESPVVVRVLIDPWSEYASVWRIDLAVGTVHKLHDGPNMSHFPYREMVEY